MSNQLPVVHSVGMSFGDIERLALAVAKSNLFGIKTPEQALTLMMVSQAEGRHPALAARDYHVIQGQPAKKAEAMQRDFIMAGGKVEWHALDDTKADATFSHPQGGTFRCTWDMERARQAGINNPMYKKYPRQMLRSRCVSEGVRTVFPAATSGMYVPEEVQDFDERPMRDVTPQKRTPPHDLQTGEIRDELFAAGPTTADLEHRFEQIAASGDMEKLAADWRALTTEQRVALGAGRGTSGPKMERWKNICGGVASAQPQVLSGGPAEPPAGEATPELSPEVPKSTPPQADQFADTFGSNDEAFCHHAMLRMMGCKTHAEGLAVIADPLIKKRMENDLPQEMWRTLWNQMQDHLKTLPEAAE